MVTFKKRRIKIIFKRNSVPLTPLAQEKSLQATCRALFDQIWRFAPFKKRKCSFLRTVALQKAQLFFKKRNCSFAIVAKILQSRDTLKNQPARCDASSLGPCAPKSTKRRLSPDLSKKSHASSGCKFLCARGVVGLQYCSETIRS